MRSLGLGAGRFPPPPGARPCASRPARRSRSRSHPAAENGSARTAEFLRRGRRQLRPLPLRDRSHGEGCDSSPVGYIEALWVDAAMRRKGVADRLVAAALDWCRERGLTELCSDTQIDNLVSQAVHRRLGFEETERLVTYRMM